ncbi:unnamed protein product [Diatraea saccharalis]|uniref:Methyltransferase type 11 domain-containing protein n=1 Tax=Diatraea saccharalis TaxID=40085 RepID=A0A9N9QXN6_9NEOP|nr:unnamed protein product [Diatraea saccharalis]
MNNAELYECNNDLQKRDTLECLEEYAKKLKWNRTGDRIIDIGCAEGSVTVNLLKEYIPKNFKVLLGCDVSEKMVTFANVHHKDERTSFSVLDIARKVPEEMCYNFDHVFSFYAFHWIKDQETAFCNIFDLLEKGGQCLLTFLGHNPMFDVYRILAKSNKWSCWLEDVEKFISPYHDSQVTKAAIVLIMNILIKKRKCYGSINHTGRWSEYSLISLAS